MILHVWLPVDECVGVVVKYDTSIPGNQGNATSCKKAGPDGKKCAPERARRLSPLRRPHDPPATIQRA